MSKFGRRNTCATIIRKDIVAAVCRINKAKLLKTADKQFGTRIKHARFLTVLYYAVPFRPRLIHQYVSRFRALFRIVQKKCNNEEKKPFHGTFQFAFGHPLSVSSQRQEVSCSRQPVRAYRQNEYGHHLSGIERSGSAPVSLLASLAEALSLSSSGESFRIAGLYIQSCLL